MKARGTNKKEKLIKSESFAIEEPQLEFSSNRQLVVDGCKSILEYEPETVKLKLYMYNVRIIGHDLILNNLNNETVMITGFIQSLEFMA
jgi:sporulation protein YqfC